MNTHVGLSGQILPDDMKDEKNDTNNSPEIDPKWLKIIGAMIAVIIIGVVAFVVAIKIYNNVKNTNNDKVSDTQVTMGEVSTIGMANGQALVILDGKSTSRFTPFSLTGLKDGEHSIWLSSEKGDWQADINIKNKSVESINAIIGSQSDNSAKEYGEILISSNPIGASIFFDDERLDEVTPSRIENLSPGNHKISLQLEGYSPWGEELTVASGTTKSFSAILETMKYLNKDDEEMNIISEFTRINSGWRKFENLTYDIEGEIPKDWGMKELDSGDLMLLYPEVGNKAEYQDTEFLIVFDDDQEDNEPVMTINITSLSEDQLIENMINFYGDQIEIDNSVGEEIAEEDNFVNGQIEESQFTIITGADDSYNFLISYKVDEDIFEKFMNAFQILENGEVLANL